MHPKPEQHLGPTAEHDPFATDKVGYRAAASLTGLKIATLQSKVSRRQIPHYRLGRRLVVFSRAELERWLEERKVAAARGPR